jgi:hypothetical protein
MPPAVSREEVANGIPVKALAHLHTRNNTVAQGTFNTPGFGPYSFDQGAAEFYRQQQEAAREASHVARAAHWLANQLVGVPLRSEQETWEMCRELAETMYGDRVAGMDGVIRAAARLVWLAEVQRATTDPLPRAEVVEQPRTVIYRAA